MISVVIPAYNAEKYLRACVESVKAQTLPRGFEIIVVDDGSKDETACIACACGCEVIKQQNAGAAAARNAGVARSSGAYLFFQDADDVLTPGALAALLAPMLEDAELQAVFALAQNFSTPENGASEAAESRPFRGVLSGTALMRRSVWDAIGPFDMALKTGETVAWRLALRDSGIKTAEIDCVTLLRRVHAHNAGVLDKPREYADYLSILRKRLGGRGKTDG